VRVEEESHAALQSARIVVAGGRGLQNRETFDRCVRDFAAQIGAETGATRAAVDAGWASKHEQIGISGVQIDADVYIALGISGSLHHMSGLRRARHVIAVNKDAAAPVFNYACHGFVGDAVLVVPELARFLANEGIGSG
jgi:electron transfer flavoprotein alpha subunit